MGGEFFFLSFFFFLVLFNILFSAPFCFLQLWINIIQETIQKEKERKKQEEGGEGDEEGEGEEGEYEAPVWIPDAMAERFVYLCTCLCIPNFP